MEPNTPPLVTPHDPDLDPPSTRRRGRVPRGANHIPQEYQRLVANPFLALAALGFWGAGLRVVLESRNLAALLALGLGLALVPLLFHYHCRDCGRTGWLFRWRDHACEAVVARQADGRVRRWRGPNPTHQAVIWMYVLVCAALVAVVSRGFGLL